MSVGKQIILGILILVLACLQVEPVSAQANSEEGGNFGLGLMLGEPSGVSIKSWNGTKTAFNIGAAWSLAGRNEALHLHGDFLWHSWMEKVETGRLAFYYGLGGRIIFADDAQAGLRVPLGLNYVFPTIPFDLFVEAVPILDVTPDAGFAGNGAVGLRYYF